MSGKRFTDIVCSETGHIGVTDCGIDKEFTSDEFEDFLNELNDENKKLKKKNEWLKKARDKSDTFIVKKGLGAEFLEWCVENE